MSKRGIGHVELVLSFIIFVAALAFALMIFNPANTDKFVETSLTYAFNEILKNTTTELEAVSVKINNETIIADEDVIPPVQIETLDIQIPSIKSEMKSDVKTDKGAFLESKREDNGDIIHIKSALSDRWRNIRFITIFFNDEFIEENIGAGISNQNYYAISSSESRAVFMANLKYFSKSPIESTSTTNFCTISIGTNFSFLNN